LGWQMVWLYHIICFQLRIIFPLTFMYSSLQLYFAELLSSDSEIMPMRDTWAICGRLRREVMILWLQLKEDVRHMWFSGKLMWTSWHSAIRNWALREQLPYDSWALQWFPRKLLSILIPYRRQLRTYSESSLKPWCFKLL
jgi:hypothetical protein